MSNIAYAIAAGFALMLASLFGSAVSLIFKKISHRSADMSLGFAAGVMLAAAVVGLLPEMLTGSSWFSILTALIGVVAGGILISLLDRFIPHEHEGNIAEVPDAAAGGEKKYSRVFLLAAAIAIHNVPEGLAVGVGFSGGLTDNALLLAISMAIQKIPEGAIVAIPLLAAGHGRAKAFKTSLLVALMVLPGAVLGAIFTQLPPQFTAFAYSFTFGAILYVIGDEIIPESHSHGFQKAATFSLIAGFMAIVVLNALL